LNVPLAVGVPEMVMVLSDHAAETPSGKPVAVPIPVAPVVVKVIAAMALFKHTLVTADGLIVALFWLELTVTNKLS
jgi:hypothetical protein